MSLKKHIRNLCICFDCEIIVELGIVAKNPGVRSYVIISDYPRESIIFNYYRGKRRERRESEIRSESFRRTRPEMPQTITSRGVARSIFRLI